MTDLLSLRHIAERLTQHQPTRVPPSVAPRRAAVAIILRNEGAVEALYIRRGDHPEDPWSGQMAFPGGHVEEDDDGAIAAAQRETLEEVGIDLSRDAESLGRLDELRAMARGKQLGLAITPTVFVLHRDVVPRPAPDEVAETIWIPLAALANGKHAGTMRYPMAEPSFLLPCWRYEGRTIWGLTYLMTRNLLQLVGVEDLPGDPRPIIARHKTDANPLTSRKG